jgi:hypothetical protein
LAADPPGPIGESWAHGIQGCAGMLGFAASVATIIDCILIANTCAMTASGRQFVFFLKEQSFFMEIPKHLFVLTCFFNTVQVVVVSYEIYESYVSALSTIVMLVTMPLLYRRYMKVSRHVGEAVALEGFGIGSSGASQLAATAMQ